MLKKQNFDWNVAGLGTYVDEQSEVLRAKQVTQGRTLSLINILDGVKGSQELKLVDDTITWQAAACEGSTSGDTTFTDKQVATVDVMLYKGYCMSDLKNTWANLALAPGAMAEMKNLPFEEQIVNYVLLKHADALETAIWQGDTVGGAGNNALFNGFAVGLNSDGSVVEANTTGQTTLTNSNAYAAVLAVVRNAPEAVIESGDFAVFCGRATFDKVRDNLFNLNLYNVPVGNDNNMSLTIPATGITLYAVPGLNGTNHIFGGKRSSFIFATDVSGDWSNLEIWYEIKDDKVYVRNKFRAGTVYPFSEEMVKFTLAAS